MGAEGFTAPLLGALQACVSVLLTICYGLAAQRLQFIRKPAIDDMAALGVKIFLPALIFVDNIYHHYLLMEKLADSFILIAWSIIYICSSIGLAQLLSRALNLPPWVTPTCAFNNTTSLPLLLVQSLERVGSLRLILRDGDTEADAVLRAQSYFLVCAVVSKTIGYAVGPKMLETQSGDINGQEEQAPAPNQEDTEAQCAAVDGGRERGSVDEQTSLIPGDANKADARGRVRRCGGHALALLPKKFKKELMTPFESPFADVMILCTLVGAFLGSVPSLHKAFFNRSDEGGIFNAWLTSSIKNIGKLFTTLQIFIVGGKLGLSFEQMSGGSGRIPLRAIVTIFLFRLVLWPALSISLIYALAKKTHILQNDPILWFTMMLMPAGPPALVISGLAELAKIPESEEVEVAKTLTIMYALSPFVSFSITGALKACQAALQGRSI